MLSFASDVLDVVGQCGVRHDANGVRADNQRFSRSLPAWRDAIHRCAADPTVEQGAVYLGALLDATPVWGDQTWTSVRWEMDAARRTHRFGLPEHSRHHALGDALTTAQLFLATACLLFPERNASVAELLNAGRLLTWERRRRWAGRLLRRSPSNQ
jgi:hypothetical protein